MKLKPQTRTPCQWQVLSCVVLIIATVSWLPAYGQSGFDDDRVMLQGFYWESYRHGHPEKPQFSSFGNAHWYSLVQQQASTINMGRFDLIWLPPPSYAGQYSAGYNPKEYFRLDNSYGTFDEHRAMLEALLQYGVEPIADIVINHRDGSQKWADFQNPTWDTKAITKYDEAFYNTESEVYNTPESKRGADEESTNEYAPMRRTAYGYGDFRDLDHTNVTVQQDIVKYLLQLRSMGYRGWRYDMVHGYHARRLAYYNTMTNPTFSVGEYDWGAHNEQRGWMWYTATDTASAKGNDHIKSSSSVFDFTTFFTLKANKGMGQYFVWYGFGNGIGMVGDTTDNLSWKNRSVTFLENHDTGYRTNEDGTPQAGHEYDSFQNGWEVEQAYAQILTHPGIPTVYWKHYFDWGQGLTNKIQALINARKVAGVHAGSTLLLQDNARGKGVYAARIQGRNGDLYMRVGGSDADWQPSDSNYRDYREYAQGTGWKVWVSLPGNPTVQQAPRKTALPVPTYVPPD